MSQTYLWPATEVNASNPSVGTNGNSAPASSTQVAGQDPGGDLAPLQTNATGALITTPEAGSVHDVNLIEVDGVAVTLGQKAMAASIPVVIASDQSTLPISAASLPLPTGAATEATLSTRATEATLSTRATEATLSTRAAETTLQAFSDKSAGAFVPEAFDYTDISYVGASTRIDQVIYKSGGAGGTTVATLTLGYDGSDRLTSVTKT